MHGIKKDRRRACFYALMSQIKEDLAMAINGLNAGMTQVTASYENVTLNAEITKTTAAAVSKAPESSAAVYEKSGDLYELILNIIDTMPGSTFILALVVVTMIAFYATSFDSIAYTAACYSYKNLGEDELPHYTIELLWCLLLIVLPIGLVFSESSMSNIQSVSIISAFPIGIIMIIMIWSFIKDAGKYMSEIKLK